MSTYPIHDADRGDSPGRVVIEELGHIEPYVEERDSWAVLALRVSINQGSGPDLEIGPYTLDRCEVEKLRAVITVYDRITRPQAARRDHGTVSTPFTVIVGGKGADPDEDRSR